MDCRKLKAEVLSHDTDAQFSHDERPHKSTTWTRGGFTTNTLLRIIDCSFQNNAPLKTVIYLIYEQT